MNSGTEKKIVCVEFWDPTVAIHAIDEEADITIYKAYGEIEEFGDKFYFLYCAYPQRSDILNTKMVNFIIPKGCIKKIIELKKVDKW